MSKFLLSIVVISTAVFLIAQIVPIEMKLLYEFVYYGSLPWSYPWFERPFMACLDACSTAAIMRYLGFILNAVILSLLVRLMLEKSKGRQT